MTAIIGECLLVARVAPFITCVQRARRRPSSRGFTACARLTAALRLGSCERLLSAAGLARQGTKTAGKHAFFVVRFGQSFVASLLTSREPQELTDDAEAEAET